MSRARQESASRDERAAIAIMPPSLMKEPRKSCMREGCNQVEIESGVGISSSSTGVGGKRWTPRVCQAEPRNSQPPAFFYSR